MRSLRLIAQEIGYTHGDGLVLEQIGDKGGCWGLYVRQGLLKFITWAVTLICLEPWSEHLPEQCEEDMESKKTSSLPWIEPDRPRYPRTP